MSDYTKGVWSYTEPFEDEYGYEVVTIGLPDPEHGESGATYAEDAIANVFGSEHDATANARRIVACVNACAGLDIDELNEFGLGTAIGTEVHKLRERCSALESALVEIESWSSHTLELAIDQGSNGVRDFYRCIARDALAKAESK